MFRYLPLCALRLLRALWGKKIALLFQRDFYRKGLEGKPQRARRWCIKNNAVVRITTALCALRLLRALWGKKTLFYLYGILPQRQLHTISINTPKSLTCSYSFVPY